MSCILVTGGAGAIGFHLSKALAQQGHDVYVVDNYLRSSRDRALETLFQKPNVYELNIDLCCRQVYKKLPLDVDYIYHLAALNGTQNFYDHPFDVLKHSTRPTIELLDHYKNSTALKRFIYAGSSEAYASTVTLFNWVVPTDEKVPLSIADPTNVRWSYGGSKLHGELATVAAGKQFDLPFSIIRYHNVYGPRMGDKHVIPDFLARAHKGCYELYGYEDTRSFIYVEDAVAATIGVAQSPKTFGEIINIGSDQELTMLALAKTIMRLLGRNDEIQCYASPSGSVKRRCPSLQKLKALIPDYAPRFSLEEGLQRTIDFYMA